MTTLVLSYSPQDEAAAIEISDFLRLNLDVEISCTEGLIRGDVTLIEAVERAVSAPVTLVLLSPQSVPRIWKREEWEPAFFRTPLEFGTLLGFVLLKDCKFPDLLRRNRFFDASQDPIAAARAIKRWLLRPARPTTPSVDHPPAWRELPPKLVDHPGIVAEVSPEIARKLVLHHALDFEAIYSIDCRGRTEAGILGDIAQGIGLRLTGSAQENRAALIRWAESHRCLFTVTNLEPARRDLLTLGGRVSVVFTTASESAADPPFEEISAVFRSSPRDEDRCVSLIAAATRRFTETSDDRAESLGWALVAVLKAADRFAEATEILETMRERCTDENSLRRIDWELSWMQDYTYGRLRYSEEPVQLTLGLDIS